MIYIISKSIAFLSLLLHSIPAVCSMKLQLKSVVHELSNSLKELKMPSSLGFRDSFTHPQKGGDRGRLPLVYIALSS